MSDRINCCVPHCRRTRKNVLGYAEWICPIHWRGIPRVRRQEHSRLKSEFRRGRIATENFRSLENELWDSLKVTAVEVAAGIR
jgi:hypothetical protein